MEPRAPSASAPVGRLCNNFPLQWERKSGGGTGLRAAPHHHIHIRLRQWRWTLLLICQFAHPPSRQCAPLSVFEHYITNFSCCGTEGKVCWHAVGARGINTWAQREQDPRQSSCGVRPGESRVLQWSAVFCVANVTFELK